MNGRRQKRSVLNRGGQESWKAGSIKFRQKFIGRWRFVSKINFLQEQELLRTIFERFLIIKLPKKSFNEIYYKTLKKNFVYQAR